MWRGRVALPRDLRGTSIKREHALLHVLWTCYAGRAGVHLPSEAGTPDMTIGRAEADRVGARPYLRRRPSGSVLLFLGLHTQNNTLPVSPFLERFLDRSDRPGEPKNNCKSSKRV